jgi:hypothetical protein
MMLALKMAMCCADLGFAAYPLNLNNAWLTLLWEEFYQQTDYEASKGMEPTLPFHRSQDAKNPVHYAVFIQHIALPLFETWADFVIS